MTKENFLNCPHCGSDHDNSSVAHRQYFDLQRIQNSDDLNADPKPRMIELWYCLWCGKYFRVYYDISAITKLEEFTS